MLPLLIFTILLAGMMLFVEPNLLLCASTLSSGLVHVDPHPIFALALVPLVPLFFALRTRYAGFVLLVPSVVSAAMTFEGASLALVGSIVMLVSRFRSYLPFVLLASAIVLVLLAGYPLALIGMLTILIGVTREIPSSKWRVRALFAWFAAAFLSSVLLDRYVQGFSFELVGAAMTLPIEPVVFTAVVLFSILSIASDIDASIIRALVMLLGSVLFAELALFAMPLILGTLALSVERSEPPVRLKGARVVTVILVGLALVLSYAPAQEPVDVEKGIVLTPDFLVLSCEGRTYPERIDRSGALVSIVENREPLVLDQLVVRDGITHVVYPEGYDAPIVFATEHSFVLDVEERDGLIVASLS